MYTKASSTYYRHNGTHPAHGTLHLPPHVLDFFTPIDPKLPHLAVDNQPRSPLSPCLFGHKPPSHQFSDTDRSIPFLQCGEARLQGELTKLRWERFTTMDDYPPEG